MTAIMATAQAVNGALAQRAIPRVLTSRFTAGPAIAPIHPEICPEHRTV